MDLTNWIGGYARAWETADDELICALFTQDASYRASPFREPFLGHAEIRSYWRRAAGTQRDTAVRMGEPFVDGDRVAVEWWATMEDGGEQVTLPGCLLLRMAGDGRCADLREYWNVESGRREPFQGWGS
jgi:ketosteroid isomerase-like protein